MKYQHILFDIDSTLVSFDKSFADAAAKVLALGGHQVTDEYIKEYYQYNDSMWHSLELDHVERQDILNNYHTLYVEYLTKANLHAKEHMKLQGSVEELTQCFITELGACAVPNPDSVRVVKELSKDHIISIATNGLVAVQPGKLTSFSDYLQHVYISEAVGYIKPQPEYYSYIINDLGCTPADCLMVGDSLVNDIGGANLSGIASCYYNPDRIKNTTGIKGTYEIKSFTELLEIVK